MILWWLSNLLYSNIFCYKGGGFNTFGFLSMLLAAYNLVGVVSNNGNQNNDNNINRNNDNNNNNQQVIRTRTTSTKTMTTTTITSR